MKKLLARGYLVILLVILYAPILIIAIFSFTEAKVLGNWTGFSTKLYESLFTGGLGAQYRNGHMGTEACREVLGFFGEEE